MALGLGSNLIVRDGGVPGVVVRLGKAFAKVDRLDDTTLRCGGGASGILVSSTARDAGIAGFEFLRGIPGTVGGFVRMNGGAYGREVKDILVAATARAALGRAVASPLERARLHLSPQRRTRGRGRRRRDIQRHPGDPPPSVRRWTASPPRGRNRSRCAAAPAARPSRTRQVTRHGRWSMPPVAAVFVGDAQVSEKHCNFLLNLGSATSAGDRGSGRGGSAPRRGEERHHARMGNPACGGDCIAWRSHPDWSG